AEVDYNLNLLIEAGLIDGNKTVDPGALVRKLSWEGHDFLNDTSDPDIWSKTKERAKGIANVVGFGLVREIAKAETKAKLGPCLPPCGGAEAQAPLSHPMPRFWRHPADGRPGSVSSDLPKKRKPGARAL